MKVTEKFCDYSFDQIILWAAIQELPFKLRLLYVQLFDLIRRILLLRRRLENRLKDHITKRRG